MVASMFMRTSLALLRRARRIVGLRLLRTSCAVNGVPRQSWIRLIRSAHAGQLPFVIIQSIRICDDSLPIKEFVHADTEMEILAKADSL